VIGYRRTMRLSGLLAIVALAACTPDRPDGSCFFWADCGDGGACEYSAGAGPGRFECSFADPGCPSGRRFGEFASAGVADTCVEFSSGFDGLCDDAHACGPHLDCELGRCIAVKQLDATAQLMTAVCSDHDAVGGDVFAWGIAFGFLGSGLLPPGIVADAQPLADPPPSNPVETTAASAGANVLCLVGANGLSDCFGQGAVGTPGPWATTTPNGPHLRIAAGTVHTCGSHTTAVDCWGDNADHELDGTGTATVLATVELGQPITELTVGGRFTCAGTSTDVWCWGSGGLWTPETFEGTRGEVARVLGLDAGAVTSLDGGDSHVCAIKGGHVWCWGHDDFGQSSGQIHEVPVGPTKPLGDAIAIAVVAGKAHSCAVLEDHTVTCWGNNAVGQLGVAEATTTAAIAVPLGARAIGPLAAGDNVTCAVLEDSLVRCWGTPELTTDAALTMDGKITLAQFPVCL